MQEDFVMKFLKLVSVLFFFLSTSSAWAVTADQVVDRESLKEFVQKAAAHLEADYDQALKDFNEEGDWKSGDNYISIFILDFQGIPILNSYAPAQRIKDLIRTAQNEVGGGFVDYIIPPGPGARYVGGPSKDIYYVQHFIDPNGKDFIVGSIFHYYGALVFQ